MKETYPNKGMAWTDLTPGERVDLARKHEAVAAYRKSLDQQPDNWVGFFGLIRALS